MALQIVLSPDERLREECEPIDQIDDDIKKLAQQMAKTMYKYEGCGIAAPQVGVLKQLIVIDCDWGDTGKKNPIFLINPEIVEKSDDIITECEGCLSIPGVSFEIERSRHVVVHARDLEGRLMQYDAKDGLFCRCLQHEIDHLHGITMFERLKPQDRLSAVRAYHEALDNGAMPGDTEV